MNARDRIPDITSRIEFEHRAIGFIDWQPRGKPGYESDIADVFGLSRNQTDNLLSAVDYIDDELHGYKVERYPIPMQNSEPVDEDEPVKIRVVVSIDR